MSPCSVRYLSDPLLNQAANARGENYWYAYILDVLEQVGVTAAPIGRRDLSARGLEGVRVLILPDLPAEYLPAECVAELSRWLAEGGLLIGLATQGLDELFGLEDMGRIEQPGDPWTYSATCVLTDPELARPLYSPETLDAPLLCISPVRLVQGMGRELARLVSVDGDDLGGPAVSLRPVEEGFACYFAFDLCQTVWTLHQGRPIDADHDGDGYFRMSDAIVIRPFRIDVPYADLLVLLLRNVISLSGLSFIHWLPPTEDGRVPDALFYYGGDDEAAEGTQVPASDFMRQQGLPYHFNIMPHPDGSFGLTKAEYERIRANGHETSLHFNYIEGHEHPYAFTESDIRRQVQWYRRTFYETPVCSVFHWTLWHGWSEPAEWMATIGLQADNSRIHAGSPPVNPVDLCGYSFGTALPFWYRSDYRRGNRRVNFLSEQIVAYECGYKAGEGTSFDQLHRALRDAAYWHLSCDMFWHPVNVAGRPECREAIVEHLRYIGEIGIVAVHMGNDELNHWWRARSAAIIEETAEGAQVTCDWPAGCILVRRSEEGKQELGGRWEYRVVKGEG